jgi:hypothetical protein
MSYNRFYAGALLAIIFLVIRPIVRALISPLRSVPGPFLARFTRLWELHVVHKHDFATYNIALHKKYGAFFTQFQISTYISRTHRQTRAQQV